MMTFQNLAPDLEDQQCDRAANLGNFEHCCTECAAKSGNVKHVCSDTL